MTAPTRAELERALEYAATHWTYHTTETQVILAAARAYRDSLPKHKVVWTVMTGNAHAEFGSVNEAAEDLRRHLLAGGGAGTIERVTVPA